MTAYDLFMACGADDVPVEGIRKGTIALWRGADATDFGPAIDPLNNLGDVRFHSDFDYLRFSHKVTSRDSGRSPVSVVAWGSEFVGDRTDVLFAHGMDPAPLAIGVIEVNGYKQPLAGSMTPLPGGNYTTLTNWRICSLVVDDTNISLRSRGGHAPAMTIHWEVYVLAEAFQVRGQSEFMVYLDPTEIDGAQIGKVSTEYRFLSEADGIGDFRVLGGQQTLVAGAPGTTQGSDGVTDFVIPWACSPYTNDWSWGGWQGSQPGGSHHVDGAEVEL